MSNKTPITGYRIQAGNDVHTQKPVAMLVEDKSGEIVLWSQVRARLEREGETICNLRQQAKEIGAQLEREQILRQQTHQAGVLAQKRIADLEDILISLSKDPRTQSRINELLQEKGICLESKNKTSKFIKE